MSAGEQEAETALRRLFAAVRALGGKYQMDIDCSVGGVIAGGGQTDLDALLIHADAALYAAKRAGGHTYVINRAQPL